MMKKSILLLVTLVIMICNLHGVSFVEVTESMDMILQFELTTSTNTEKKIELFFRSNVQKQPQKMVLIRKETKHIYSNRKRYKYIYRVKSKVQVCKDSYFSITGRIYYKRRYRKVLIKRVFKSMKNSEVYELTQSSGKILRLKAWIMPLFKKTYTDIVIYNDDL
ncbi:hypothetical protein KAJ27_14095 [bacterium]|nr:hypothetical protein [bacterium]